MKCGEKLSKVLLVDDDELIRSMLYNMLIDQGYSVVQAADGIDAIEKFKNYMHEIVLVISDIIMPRMDGISSCKIMTSLSPSLKVVFISGYTSAQPLPDGVSFLAKPFSPVDLLKAVQSLLSDPPKS
jgi:Response regulator containing CheY-like receiver, AAA-type ATPase, and DNA-binding domains